jgi:hypothetical protein
LILLRRAESESLSVSVHSFSTLTVMPVLPTLLRAPAAMVVAISSPDSCTAATAQLQQQHFKWVWRARSGCGMKC